MGRLVYLPVVEEREKFLAEVRSLGDAATKALTTGDKGDFRRELEAVGKSAAETTKRLDPLRQSAVAFDRAISELTGRVKAGALSLEAGARQLRAYEAAMRTQLGTVERFNQAHTELARVMKSAAAEAQRLESAQRGAAAGYRTDDIKRYAVALNDITSAQKAGLVSQRDALAQLKSLQGAMSQYYGSLRQGSAEQQALTRVMAATGTEAKRLEAAAQRTQAAFRADVLRTYAGELRQIDAAVKSGTSGFDRAVGQVEALSRGLREQGSQLDLTGREYDQLSRLLQAAAVQQERYQRAAEQAQRANDTAQIRTYGNELKQLEVQLQDTAKQYGTLDSQQRALKYDPSGIRAYRTETEQLERAQQDSLGAFSRVGQGLTELKSKLEAAAQSAGTGTRQYADLERLLQGVERATVATAQAQERSQQAYRAADLSRFVTELRNIEAAQRSGVTTAEQAARAVSQLQGEFKEYATSLTGVGRELDQLTGAQRDVAIGATALATAQERAVRSFDSAALRSFVGELQTLVREQREGSASFEDTARAVEGLQGRLREYGSTLQDGSREQAELNRVLELSDRALTELGTAAARAAQGFDPQPVQRFTSELEGLSGTGRELGSAFGTIEGELNQLDQSLRDTGDGANLSARELGALEGVYRQLEGATERFAQAQDRAQGAFHAEEVRQQVAALADLKLALERGEISQEQFSTSARNIGTALEQARSGLDANTRAYAGYTGALTRVQSSLAQAEGRVRTFGVAAGVSAGVGDQLQNVMFRMGVVGEGMAVAMYSASAGMTGAATSAKLLNIALAAGLVGALVAAVVGFGAVVKQAFNLDTGLTDVAKTTGFTGGQLDKLADNLQGVALATGTPVKNLLEIAGVAGSLGVTGVENVTKFTEVVNKLAIASDVVGEAGAAQLANFVNITKEAGQSVGDAANLVGNVVVALGNSLSATEAPILALATRIGGLSTTANLSQDEILGLAGGFASLGFTAEGAGTSLQSIVNKIAQAGQVGGPALVSLAKGAGMTATEFQALAKASPADAFVAYIQGLKEAKDAGENITPIVKEITKENETMLGVITRAVGGFDTLSLSMNTAATESRELNAMNEELRTRLAGLQGSWDRLIQVVGFLRDKLALALAPAMADFINRMTDAAYVIGNFFGVISDDRLAQLQAELNGTAGEVQSVGDKALEASGKVKGFGDSSDTAISKLANLDTATGKRGFQTTLDTLIGSLSGKAKQAMQDFADSTLAPIVEQGHLQEAVGLTVVEFALLERAALQASISADKAAFANLGLTIQQLGFDLQNAKTELAETERLMGTSQTATNFLTARFEQQSAEVDRLQASFDNATSSQVQLGDKTIQNSAKLDELNGILGNTTDASQATGEQQAALAEHFGQTGSAATGAGTAVEQFGRLLEQQTNITRMSEEQARGYKDKLLELRDAYPNLRSQIDPLIAATNEQIRSFDKAGGSATDLGTTLEETGRTAAEMARNIVTSFQNGQISARTALDSLTSQLIALKVQKAAALASGDYDPADIAAFNRDITATQNALNQVTPVIRQLGVDASASVASLNPFALALRTFGTDSAAAFEIVRSSATAAAQETTRSANEVATATRAWGDAVYTTAEAQGDMRQSVIDATAQLSAQDAVLKQLGLAIVTEDTNRLASAQQLAADNASRATESWRTLKETQDAYAGSARLTLEQTRLLSTVMGDVRGSLQEAVNVFKATGDAAQFNADKTDILKAALETLYRAGIDPATVGLGKWVTALGESEDKLTAQEQATLDAAKAAEAYAENMDALRNAQDALGDASSIATEDIDEMIRSLDAAAQGTGLLGQQARQAQADLQALAVAREVAEGLDEIAAAADRALAEIPNLSTGAKAGLEALSAAAKEASKALADGMVTPTEGIGILGAGIDALAEGFRDQLSPAAYAGIKAIDGIAQAAMQAASGDYIGAAVTAVGTLVGAIVDFFTESAREAEQYRVAMEKTMESLERTIDQTIDNLQQLYDFEADTGGLDEISNNIIQTQLDLIENQRSVNEQIDEVNERRNEALVGITDPAVIAEINAGFDAEIDAIKVGGQQEANSIIENGANNAIAAGQSADDFINGLVTSNGEIIGEIDGGAEAIGGAVGGYADAIGNDWDNAGSEMREAMEAALQEQIDSFRDATDEWENALLDSRIRLAEAQGASDIELLILETNAKLLDAHRQFMDDMSDLETDKEEIIRGYILANPGVSRAEAEAYAESIVGPGRDALREEYANTSAAILLESEQQAKDLGLSQKEFWRAVMEGNTEVLGDMSEEQRQAYIDFLALSREYGIELPAYLEEMYNNIYGAHAEGGARVSEGAQHGNAEHMATLANVYSQLRTLLGPAADEIIALIEKSYGEQYQAHDAGGAQVAEGAQHGNAQHMATLANIYSQLRTLLGPAADQIIDMIEGSYNDQYGAHVEGGEVGAQGATQGGLTAAGGIAASQDLQLAAIERLKSSLVTGAAGIGGQVTPAIAAEHQKLMDAFIQGAQTSGGGIDAAERAQIAAMQQYQNGLNTGAGNILTTVTPAVGRAHEAISGAFGIGANLITGAVGTGSTTVSAAIGRGYSLMGGAQTAGSSGMVGNIQRSYQAEQAKFQSESAILLQRISTSKGAEQDRLIEEYNQLQKEHETKSRSYQTAIGDAASGEDKQLGLAAKLVSGALIDMGGDDVAAQKKAYDAMKEHHARMSLLYRGVMDTAASDEKKRAIAAGDLVGGSILTAAVGRGGVVDKTKTAFADQGTAYVNAADAYKRLVEEKARKVKEAIANALKDFAFKMPQPTLTAQGVAGTFAPMTSFAGAPDVGAFAADGIPDYAGAETRAYAAASPLLELFGGRDTLRLTTTIERSLSIEIRAGDFSGVFDRPVAMLERLLNSMWDNSRYERETARFNRETAELLRRNTDGGTYELARRPRKRTL